MTSAKFLRLLRDFVPEYHHAKFGGDWATNKGETDLFQILLELSKGISLDFKFCCFGSYNKNYKPFMIYLCLKTKDYCFLTRKVFHQFFFKK